MDENSLKVHVDSKCWNIPFSAVEPEEKTWQTLAKGDVIVSPSGDSERLVLEVLGDLVFDEDENNEGYVSDFIWTKQEYQKKGWTIKQPEKTEEVTEMTVAECAKKLGVKNLKIVE